MLLHCCCQVDSRHENTVGQLGDTVDQVAALQGKVRQSLKELQFFLAGLGKVAEDAASQLDSLQLN